jgi:hypothetical protein
MSIRFVICVDLSSLGLVIFFELWLPSVFAWLLFPLFLMGNLLLMCEDSQTAICARAHLVVFPFVNLIELSPFLYYTLRTSFFIMSQ